MIEKQIKELTENYQDLLKELSYKLMQTTHVLKIANSIPEEEKKTIEGLLECANNTLFEASLRNSGDLIDTYKILQGALIVTEHNKDIQLIALKYAPKYPNKVKNSICNHSFSGKGGDFDEISKAIARIEPEIEKLRQLKIKEKFNLFKKYHEKTSSN